MSKKFKLELIDAEGTYDVKEIEVLTCQTELGEISILPNHHPIIAICKKGKIKIKYNGNQEFLDLPYDSILEFRNNHAKLLSIFRVKEVKFKK